MTAFIHVEVEPGPAHEDGLSLRFKRAGDERAVRELPYESEDGLAGRWRAFATDDPEGEDRRAAHAYLVEDSSDGVAWLIVGGRHGVVLEHVESGARAREPYLVLSKSTVLEG
jgi:hypothetical protein